MLLSEFADMEHETPHLCCSSWTLNPVYKQLTLLISTIFCPIMLQYFRLVSIDVLHSQENADNIAKLYFFLLPYELQ